MAVGDIRTMVTADVRQYRASMSSARGSTMQYTESVRRADAAQRQMQGGGRRLTPALSQVSFAIDDIANTTGDWTMKLRGAANNVNVLVTSISPVAGIFTTIGLVALPLVIKQFFKAGEAAKQAAKDFEKARTSYDEFREATQKRIALARGDGGQLGNEIQTLRDDIIARRATIDKALRDAVELEAQASRQEAIAREKGEARSTLDVIAPNKARFREADEASAASAKAAQDARKTRLFIQEQRKEVAKLESQVRDLLKVSDEVALRESARAGQAADAEGKRLFAQDRERRQQEAQRDAAKRAEDARRQAEKDAKFQQLQEDRARRFQTGKLKERARELRGELSTRPKPAPDLKAARVDDGSAFRAAIRAEVGTRDKDEKRNKKVVDQLKRIEAAIAKLERGGVLRVAEIRSLL